MFKWLKRWCKPKGHYYRTPDGHGSYTNIVPPPLPNCRCVIKAYDGVVSKEEAFKRYNQFDTNFAANLYKGIRKMPYGRILNCMGFDPRIYSRRNTMMDRDVTRPVKFILARRYYMGNDNSNGMSLNTCTKVFENAFGRAQSWYHVIKNHSANMCNSISGIEVVCTQDQFARFIIARHQLGGCINGVRDLDPKLMTYSSIAYDHVKHLADKANLTRNQVASVLESLKSYEFIKEGRGPIDVR